MSTNQPAQPRFSLLQPLLSVKECLLPAWKVKNRQSIYTLVIVLFSVGFTSILLYRNGLLALLAQWANVQLLFVYTIPFYLLIGYAGLYPVVREDFSWRGDKAYRNQFFYPLCLLSFAVLMVYLKGNVGIWHAVIVEALAKQGSVFLNQIVTVYYSIIDGPSGPFYAGFHNASGKLDFLKVMGDYLLFVVIELVGSVILIVLLAVLIIPVALSFLGLNEGALIAIYGIAFPAVRYLFGHLTAGFISGVAAGGILKDNPQGLTLIKFTLAFLVALFFSAAPLFCMLLLSPNPGAFALSYLPHAFFSKIVWFKNIPQVQSFISKIIFCFRGRMTMTIIPQQDVTEIDESGVELSDEEKKRRKAEEVKKVKEAIGNNSTVLEAADLIVHWLAIVFYLLRLFGICFFVHGSEGTSVTFDDVKPKFTNFLITLFCIIIPIDQIVSTGGFALLLTNSISVDANFQLDVNPLNPLRSLGKGHWYRAIGSLSFCLCLMLAVSVGIAIGTYELIF